MEIRMVTDWNQTKHLQLGPHFWYTVHSWVSFFDTGNTVYRMTQQRETGYVWTLLVMHSITDVKDMCKANPSQHL